MQTVYEVPLIQGIGVQYAFAVRVGGEHPACLLQLVLEFDVVVYLAVGDDGKPVSVAENGLPPPAEIND